jgi:hypothetical protein
MPNPSGSLVIHKTENHRKFSHGIHLVTQYTFYRKHALNKSSTLFQYLIIIHHCRKVNAPCEAFASKFRVSAMFFIYHKTLWRYEVWAPITNITHTSTLVINVRCFKSCNGTHTGSMVISLGGRDSLDGIVTRYRQNGLGFWTPMGVKDFIFFRPALGLTQFPLSESRGSSWG